MMNQSSQSGVILTGIVKRFGGVVALAGVDLTIRAGEVLALLGENGAGKSTLIRVLTGAVTPDAGEILVDGSIRHFSHPRDARLAGIAAVYQEPAIYPHLSVLENIFAGSEITSAIGVVKTASMVAQIKPWLTHLDLGESILRRRMGELSLGYQQLVLVAKALVQDARVIIFDEPTSILSRAETERLLKIIDRLRDDDRAIVYITHRLEEVGDMADRVTVLTDGRVTGELVRGEFDEAQLLELMAGKASRDYSRRRVPGAFANAGPILEIEGLSLKGRYDDVNWSAAPGQITGVYGLIGSGRSEVALTAFGALVPDQGTIRLGGTVVAPRTPAAAIALGIGYLPEDRKLQGMFATKSIESNMTVGKLGNFSGTGACLDFKALRIEARRLVDRYRVKVAGEDVGIGTLSGGNQQKVLFARWAALDLKVLILDEPTRGIDVGTKVEIHDFIRELAADGLAVVVISSDLPEILSVSDRVVVMRKGRVVSVMEGGALKAEHILAAAVGTSFH